MMRGNQVTEKKKRGRPCGRSYPAQVALVVSAATREQLVAQAAADGITLSAHIRRLIQRALEETC